MPSGVQYHYFFLAFLEVLERHPASRAMSSTSFAPARIVVRLDLSRSAGASPTSLLSKPEGAKRVERFGKRAREDELLIAMAPRLRALRLFFERGEGAWLQDCR